MNSHQNKQEQTQLWIISVSPVSAEVDSSPFDWGSAFLLWAVGPSVWPDR